MIITRSQKIDIDLLLRCSSYLLWTVFFTVLVFFGCILFAPAQEYLDDLRAEAKNRDSRNNLSLIGNGALSLNASQISGRLSFLSHQIVVKGRNTRPDIQGRESNLLITIKGSKDEFMVSNGQKLYLNWDNEEGSPRATGFAQEPTSLWITPYIIDRSSTVIDIGLMGENHVEERAQFILEESEKTDRTDKRFERLCFKSLADAKCWGEDALISLYGGPEYLSFQDKQKLAFENPSYACFVGQGDILVWNNNRWVVNKEGNSECPIAQIKSVGPRGIEIEAWDETGFFPLHVNLSIQNPPSMSQKTEILPTDFRLRTLTQVTCVFSKRRVILKKGDWLLRTQSGWRVLSRVSDIEDCLLHRFKGDLFIFDELERDEGGKVTLKGTLFDEMRTQSQPISISVAKLKKKATHEKKKKGAFSKRDSVSSPSRPTKEDR